MCTHNNGNVPRMSGRQPASILLPANRAEQRQIHSNLLSDGKVMGILSSFGRLAESSYGPTGRLKFLQTTAGGHVAITSTSRQIIHHLMGGSHPILRLILMAIKGHLEVFNDGGLSMAILIIRMVETSLRLDIPRSLIVEVCSEAQGIISSYLATNECPWKMKIDISDMQSMLCLVRGIVRTKPACRLTDQDQELLCTVLLKAFIQSLPTIKKDTQPLHWSLSPIQFLYCEGNPVSDTKVVNGVILEAPELPTHKKNVPTASRNLQVALYNVSMAGDTEEWYKGETHVACGGMEQEKMSEGVVEQMKGVALVLVEAGVRLVACQKCIHPALKKFLKHKGVYVIERLSVLHIGSVQQLTGAKILSTFTKDIPSKWFGHIGSIEHIIIGHKSYLHLLPASESLTLHPVTTIVLCSPDETSINELKTVCQSAISILHGVISSPYVVPGGGCLDTHLAWYLRCTAWKCSSECLDKVGCTKAQYIAVMDNIASCLETVARSLEHDGGDDVTDSLNHHHWVLPPATNPDVAEIPTCVCGLVSRDQCNGEWCMIGSSEKDFSVTSQSRSATNQPIERVFKSAVLDSYLAKVSALQTVFETVNIILRIKHLVTDE